MPKTYIHYGNPKQGKEVEMVTNPGTLKFAKKRELKTGIFKLDFVCSEWKNEFIISTRDKIIQT